MLPSDLAEVTCLFFDIRPEGNWEGSNVLRTPRPLSKLAKELGVEAGLLAQRLSHARLQLLEARERRPRPLTDDKVLAGQTGLMLGAYAQAGRFLSKPEYVGTAKRAAQFVLERMVDDSGRLSRAARRGKCGQPAMLEDYAYLAEGLLDLYEATGLARYLLAADSLARHLLDSYYDNAARRLYHSPNEHEPLLFRVAEAHDGQTPNATATAADVLMRLSLLLGHAVWRETAQSALYAHGEAAMRFPRGHCDLVRVARSIREPCIIVAVIPGADETANQAIWRACAEDRRHRILLAWLPKDAGPEERALPLFTGRLHDDSKPHVHVCLDDYCSAPVHSVDGMRRQLESINVPKNYHTD